MARSQWCPHPHDQHTHHRPRDSGAKVSQHLWSFSSVTGVVFVKFSCGGKLCVTIACLKEMQCKSLSEYACQPLFSPCLSPAAIFSCYLCVYVCVLCMLCVCVCVLCMSCVCVCVVHVFVVCIFVCAYVHTSFQVPSDKKVKNKNLKQE